MRPRGLIVAIDGPSGAGKSTAGRELARRLGYVFIDTGAMYRAVAWRALCAGVALDDATALATLAIDACLRYWFHTPSEEMPKFEGDA